MQWISKTLGALGEEKPDVSLKELRAKVHPHGHKRFKASTSTLSRTLKSALGLTRKKEDLPGPQQADEKERAAFPPQGEKFWPKKRHFVFVDETKAQHRAWRGHYGRSLGCRAGGIKESSNCRATRRSLWPSWGASEPGRRSKKKKKKDLEPHSTMEGALTKEVFLLYLRERLGPGLRRGDIVFLGSARGAHRGREKERERSNRLPWSKAGVAALAARRTSTQIEGWCSLEAQGALACCRRPQPKTPRAAHSMARSRHESARRTPEAGSPMPATLQPNKNMQTHTALSKGRSL